MLSAHCSNLSGQAIVHGPLFAIGNRKSKIAIVAVPIGQNGGFRTAQRPFCSKFADVVSNGG